MFRPSKRILPPSSSQDAMRPFILALAAGEMTGPLEEEEEEEERNVIQITFIPCRTKERNIQVGALLEALVDFKLFRAFYKFGDPSLRVADKHGWAFA